MEHVEQESTALLQGRYRLLQAVGSGGFGEVYRASDSQTGKTVAIKRINLGGMSAQQVIDATDTFNREMQLLAPLKHPNIPRLYDHFTDAEHWYLVLDFIEGQTLEDYLAAHPVSPGVPLLPIKDIATMALQLCSALEYLHEQRPPIVFRDLKPSNIMRRPDGSICLVDFGTARRFRPQRTRDTVPLGSPGYASPEQYGKAQTSPSSDIYSLGALLHYLLCGEDPAETPFHFSPLHLDKDDPALCQLEALIMRMVERDATQRPQRISEVRVVLQQVLDGTTDKRGLAPLPTVGQDISSFSPAKNTVSAAYYTPTQQQQQVQQSQRSKRSNVSRRKLLKRGLIAGTVLALGTGGFFSIKHLFEPEVLHLPAAILNVAWSGDSSIFGAVDEHGNMSAWNIAHNEVQYHNHVSIGTERVLAYSPGLGSIAIAREDGLVAIVDTQMGWETIHYQRPNHSRVQALAWAANGWIASSDETGLVHVWDSNNQVTMTTIDTKMPAVSLVWSSKNQYLATINALSGSCWFWDITTNKNIGSIVPDTYKVTAVAWAPDEGYIALGDENGTVSIYDWTVIQPPASPRDFRLLGSENKHHARINALSWSPDSTQVASAGDDGSVIVCDNFAATSSIYHPPGQHIRVRTVAWSPDGQHLLAGDSARQLVLWPVIGK